MRKWQMRAFGQVRVAFMMRWHMVFAVLAHRPFFFCFHCEPVPDFPYLFNLIFAGLLSLNVNRREGNTCLFVFDFIFENGKCHPCNVNDMIAVLG